MKRVVGGESRGGENVTEKEVVEDRSDVHRHCATTVVVLLIAKLNLMS